MYFLLIYIACYNFPLVSRQHPSLGQVIAHQHTLSFGMLLTY